MRNAAMTYLAIALLFAAIDLIWLASVAHGLFKRDVGALMREAPIWEAAGLFYMLYPLAIMILALPQADGAAPRALLMGAALGLCAYGTYELTNLATLRGWTVRLALIDVAWGTALTALATWVGFLVRRGLTAEAT